MWIIFFGYLLFFRSFTLVSIGTGTAIGQDLVGTDSDGADFFAVAGIFSYQFWGYVGLVQDFLYPLAYRDGVGGKDQRGALNVGHRGKAHDGFACSTWENHYSTTAAGRSTCIKCSRGRVLVCTRREELPFWGDWQEFHGKRRAVSISCQVFGREPYVD